MGLREKPDLADSDLGAEAVASNELERSVKGELLRVVRRDGTANQHLALDFLDPQIADPSVSPLSDACRDLFHESAAIRRGIEKHQRPLLAVVFCLLSRARSGDAMGFSEESL